MSKQQIIALGVIGFTDNERVLLRSMCLLTTERDRGYLIVERKTDPPGEIILINGDDSDAISYINTATDVRYPENAAKLYIGNSALSKGHYRVIPRPITTTHLFEALDQIVEEELDHIPKLSSNEKESYINALPKNLEDIGKGQHTALVVDPSHPVRELIKIKLEKMNINVIPAVTGEQAVELMKHHTFDIIFADVTLPGVDGFEICRQIKSDQTTSFIPVCLLSEKTSPINKIKGKMSGCDEFLVKPVDSHNFYDIIRRLLKGKFELEPVTTGI